MILELINCQPYLPNFSYFGYVVIKESHYGFGITKRIGATVCGLPIGNHCCITQRHVHRRRKYLHCYERHTIVGLHVTAIWHADAFAVASLLAYRPSAGQSGEMKLSIRVGDTDPRICLFRSSRLL